MAISSSRMEAASGQHAMGYLPYGTRHGFMGEQRRRGFPARSMAFAYAQKNARPDIAVSANAPVLAKVLAGTQRNSGSAETTHRLNAPTIATASEDAPRCKVVRIEPDSHTVILDHFDGGAVGTAVGNPTYSNSQPGLIKAAKFGLGDYVRYQIRPELEAQETIEFWLKTSTYNVSLMNFNWLNTPGYPAFGHVLHLQINTAGKIDIGGWSYTNCMYGLNSSAVIPLNEWVHIALSWGAETRIYVNSVVTASSPQCYRPASPQFAYLNYWGNTPLGLMDELRISNVQRTDLEIAQHAGLYNK